MRAALSRAEHRYGGGCSSERVARKDGGRLRTVLVLLHSTTAVVLQGKMAQHTCSLSRVVMGLLRVSRKGES